MKKLFWVFPILFLIDDILGFNGYQFTVFGVGIRLVLFALTVASLCLYCLLVIKEDRICLFRRKPEQPHLLDYCKPTDFFVLAFLFVNFLWATVVPLLKNGNLAYGLKDFSTLLVFVLYFPCAFLMRTGRLTFRAVLKWLFPLLLLLALWHCVMYVGEVLFPGFYMGYYDFIDIISFGTAVRTDVIQGYGITRIIQVTSPLLIPAFLLVAEKFVSKKKPFMLLALALVLFATLITYTKSIWFGILAGVLVALLGSVIFSKDRHIIKRSAGFFLAFIMLFCLFNFGFLNNTIVLRVRNTSQHNRVEKVDAQISDVRKQLEKLENTSDDSHAKEELLKQLQALETKRQDAAGTQQANSLRAQQTSALLNKWSDSKLFGYGYGAYAEDCIRNDYPYMYESLLPALIMKLGVVGLLNWGVFVMALIVFAVKALWKKPVRFWCWIGTALAYAMAVQTNPFLFTFAGMSLMLYLLLFIADAQEAPENE